MSVLDIGKAAQNILATAIQDVAPGTSVLLGHPNNFNDDITLYLYHQGYGADIGKGPGIVWRPHHFIIHLLVRAQPDYVTAEETYLALHDAISDAFYASGTIRTLNGAALTSQLQPLGNAPSSTPYTSTPEAGQCRQQWWLLEAREQHVFVWSN